MPVSELQKRQNHLEFVVTSRTCVDLFSVFDAYMKIAGYEMEESIKRETSGGLEDLLLAVGMHGCLFFNHQTFNTSL